MEAGQALILGSARSPREAEVLLASVSRVRRRLADHRRGWPLPVTLLGVLTGVTASFYLPAVTSPATSGAASSASLSPGAGPPARVVLWLVGLPLIYLGCAAYWRSRVVVGGGIRRHRWPWVVTGLGLLCAEVQPLFAPLSLIGVRPAFGVGPAADLFVRGTAPVLTVAVALPVLAWVERSRGLGVFSIAFLGLALTVNLYNTENLLGSAGPAWGSAFGVVITASALVAAGLVGWAWPHLRTNWPIRARRQQ